MNRKFSYYTDGEKTVKVMDGDSPPDGFYKGRTFNANPWNKGLSKETDERLMDASKSASITGFQKGNIPWNLGLTKDTNDTLKVVSQKVSTARTGKPSWNKGIPMKEETKRKLSDATKGRKSWCKGQTKYTNESLMAISVKASGHKCYVTDWESAKAKEYETKKRNNSFNTSKQEDEFYEYLVSVFGSGDIIRQYISEEYPFRCDFYVKSENLYIEYNGAWEHGNHPFNPNSEEDQYELCRLESLAQQGGERSRYWNAIRWWTEIDPKKLSYLTENKLNYIIIYPRETIITNFSINS